MPNAFTGVAARLAIASALLAGPRGVWGQQRTQFEPLLGVRFGGAQHQSVYAGAAILTHITRGDRSGTALEAEVGRSAGQVGLGYVATGAGARQLRSQLVGLRTWGRATGIAPGQTFIGFESQVSMLLGVSIGYYRRVHGSVPGDAKFTAIRFVVGI